MAKTNTNQTTNVESPVEPLGADRIKTLMSDLKTKSAVIRFLASEGHKRSAIATALGIRYQHVRNVLVQAAEKADQSK